MVTQANLIDFIKEFNFTKHKDFILSLVQSVLELDINYSGNTVGISKLGGSPDLPSKFKWPKHKLDYYRFLGQFNFQELKPKLDSLPSDGILSLFVADTEELDRYDEEVHWVLGYYFNPDMKLVPTIHPKKKEQPGGDITFLPNLDLPAKEELLKQWPLNDQEKETFFGPFMDKIQRTTKSLMGYPFYKTLGYDPTPKGDWVLLLSLDSDKKLEMFWGDEDGLLIFIERQKLLQKDFSNLKVDIG